MTKHFIPTIYHFMSMLVAGTALLGFLCISEGNWSTISWLRVLINYSSIIPLCVWTTWIVMTDIAKAKADALKY